MVGKGKMGRKKQNKTSKESSKTEVKCSDLTETDTNSRSSLDLGLPYVKVEDNCKTLPKYSTILKRPVASGVLMQDLDTLQIELESLLTMVVQRNYVLSQGLDYLVSVEEDDPDMPIVLKEEKAVDDSNDADLNGPPAKCSKVHEKSAKNVKESQQADFEFKKPLPMKPKKRTRRPSNMKPKQDIILSGLDDQTSEKTCVQTKVKPKRNTKIRSQSGRFAGYDYASKFWNSMHTICHDFLEADLKNIKELIKNQEMPNSLPQLGKPFARSWAESELTDEKLAASAVAVNKRKYCRLQSTTTSVIGIIKKAEDTCKELASPPPSHTSNPLHQRLLTSLKSANVIKEEKESDVDTKAGQENDSVLRSIDSMSQNIGGPTDLESRLRTELRYIGLLTNDVPKIKDSEGDLVEEIKRLEQEFKAASSKNVEELQHVLLLSEQEMSRQELTRKVRMLDEEIEKTYRSILAQKSKNADQPLSEKVREQAWKLLKRRELLVRQQHDLNVDVLKLKSDKLVSANSNTIATPEST